MPREKPARGASIMITISLGTMSSTLSAVARVHHHGAPDNVGYVSFMSAVSSYLLISFQMVRCSDLDLNYHLLNC